MSRFLWHFNAIFTSLRQRSLASRTHAARQRLSFFLPLTLSVSLSLFFCVLCLSICVWLQFFVGQSQHEILEMLQNAEHSPTLPLILDPFRCDLLSPAPPFKSDSFKLVKREIALNIDMPWLILKLSKWEERGRTAYIMASTLTNFQTFSCRYNQEIFNNKLKRTTTTTTTKMKMKMTMRLVGEGEV